MSEKRLLVRDVYVNSYPDCEHSVKTVEAVEVEIVWPSGKEPEFTGYGIVGGWMLVERKASS